MIRELIDGERRVLDRLADENFPNLVQEGWQDSTFIPHLAGPSYRILWYPNGTARFEHLCDRGERGVVVCAPALQLDGGHFIQQREPLTITPSILCPDCGTHGFITNGRWVKA